MDEPKPDSEASEPPARYQKRVRVALPVRVTVWDEDMKSRSEMSCTYDISASGARLVGLRSIRKSGEVLAIERDKSRIFCRVVWVGEEGSDRSGQLGIQPVEMGKTLWESEIEDLTRSFDPMLHDEPRDSGHRRRYPRFECNGTVEFPENSGDPSQPHAILKNLSEAGCLVSGGPVVEIGTEVTLLVNVAGYDFGFKGEVRSLQGGEAGIEFLEVRKGDRPVLQYLLRKLGEEKAKAATQAT
jgi:hypothetical protein